MNTFRLFLAVLSSSLLAQAHAASNYDQPTETEPHAQLRITSSTSGVASSSWVSAFSTEGCEKKDGEGRLATFNLLTRGQKVLRIRPGARLYVLAGAEITPPVGAEEVRQTRCISIKSFVPEAGKVYEIRHDLITRNCPIELKDANGVEPATAQKHKAKGLCKEKT